MRFFVLLVAYILDENRITLVESRMRNATNYDDWPHDASVCSSRLSLDGINLLGKTFRLVFINQTIKDLIERL